MRSYAEITHFWRLCAHSHCEINQYVQGNSKRILELERANMDYPLLWQEDLYMDYVQDPCVGIQWTGSIVILENVKLDDHEREDFILEKLWRIADDLVKKLWQEAQECEFEMNLFSYNLEQCHTLTNDNDYGWRLSFHLLNTNVDFCPTPGKFESKCPVGAVAAFSWDISKSEDGKCIITIKDLTMPIDHDWTYSLNWIKSDQSEVEIAQDFSNEEHGVTTLEFPESEHWITICMEIKNAEGCCLCATAFFCKKKNEAGNVLQSCGFSVPYKYKMDQSIKG